MVRLFVGFSKLIVGVGLLSVLYMHMAFHPVIARIAMRMATIGGCVVQEGGRIFLLAGRGNLDVRADVRQSVLNVIIQA